MDEMSYSPLRDDHKVTQCRCISPEVAVPEKLNINIIFSSISTVYCSSH